MTDYQELADYYTHAATALNNPEHLGIAFVHLSRLAWVRNDFDQSLEFSRQAEDLLYPAYPNRYLFSVWTTMAHIYNRRGEWDRSEQLAQKMLAFGHDNNDFYLLYEGNYRLSALAAHRQDFDAANRFLDDAQSCAMQLGNRRQIIQINYRRAANLMDQGQFETAEALLIENINSYLQIGEHRHVADNKFRLAVLYQRTGRDRLAEQMARDAQEVYQKIGMISTARYLDQFIREGGGE